MSKGKENYAIRLKSPEWRAFSMTCRNRVGHQCQMCGNKERQCVVHHMRYHNLGKPKEWRDVVVICDGCHDVYHGVHRHPPKGAKSRSFLLLELAAVLMSKDVEVDFFLNHGNELADHWLLKPIHLPNPPPKEEPCVPGSRKDRKQKARKWKADQYPGTEKHAIMFLDGRTNQTRIWLDRLGIPRPTPKKWTRRLRSHLEKLYPQHGPFRPDWFIKYTYMDDSLDQTTPPQETSKP